MFRYELAIKPEFHLNFDIIDKIFSNISKIIPKKQEGTLNIIFSNNKEIQKLNHTYRNINKATDVLSFHYFEDFQNLKSNDIAGEIVLSEEKIIDQGQEYGLGEEKEFYKLLIHSTLHILGYDHEQDDDYKIMQEKEEQIWNKVFEK
ncbi:rRNA maturation RNase YbeY [Candidatus Gracilibacteria bacterium 28_42_T64]|nr:rRNA maturation RNase YbeY [Candidatus Gracilibacteria bacterium 28_42_T64]